MTEPVADIRNEIARLVDAQISAFAEHSPLNILDLLEYQVRADRLMELYGTLDRLKAGLANGWLSPQDRSLALRHRQVA